jgi:hypothetical protein
VTEIVAFCILDFVHILITWRLDGLEQSKSTSQVVNKNVNFFTYSRHHHYFIIIPTVVTVAWKSVIHSKEVVFNLGCTHTLGLRDVLCGGSEKCQITY